MRCDTNTCIIMLPFIPPRCAGQEPDTSSASRCRRQSVESALFAGLELVSWGERHMKTHVLTYSDLACCEGGVQAQWGASGGS